jgi:hypothetical protein
LGPIIATTATQIVTTAAQIPLAAFRAVDAFTRPQFWGANGYGAPGV